MTLLEARGVAKDYGKVRVLKGVDLQVRKSAVHALIGPNGAGKTTLFRVMSGEVPPDAGVIAYRGEPITHVPAWARVRMQMGRTFQVARTFKEMSVYENMLVATDARERNSMGRHLTLPGAARSRARQRAREALGEVGLLEKQATPAKSLSHGDQKRLELGMTLALEPEVLLLDEPMAGMAPGDRAAMVALIARLKESRDITVLLTEHDMDVVFTLATDLTVLNQGEVVATGHPETVRKLPIVRDIYLGHEAGTC